MHSNQPSSREPGLRKAGTRFRLVGIAAFTLVFGLLIWAKLQLVASVPRTVLAVPVETPIDRSPEDGSASATADDRP